APDLALAVPHPAVPGTAAQALAGVCAGPTVAPLCRPRHPHSGDGQRRARATLVSGQEGGLVYGAGRPADAGDQHPAGSSPQRDGTEVIRHEGLSPPRREPTGVSDGAGTPVQPHTVSTASHTCGAVWGGSRRWASTHIGLDAQPADPYFWWLS